MQYLIQGLCSEIRERVEDCEVAACKYFSVYSELIFYNLIKNFFYLSIVKELNRSFSNEVLHNPFDLKGKRQVLDLAIKANTSTLYNVRSRR